MEEAKKGREQGRRLTVTRLPLEPTPNLGAGD